MSHDESISISAEEIAKREVETQSLGMWLFLAGEILFFGSLFTIYIVYRRAYPLGFAEASRHLNLVFGALNTGVLLTSSLFMALAVNAIQRDKPRLLAIFLLITVLLGLAFLGVKAFEYSEEFQQNLFPNETFQFPAPYTTQAKLFYTVYFAATGLHALHMTIGIAIIALMLIPAWRKHYSKTNYAPVELIGLYWHFVDIVWIFVFPLFYLIDRTG